MSAKLMGQVWDLDLPHNEAWVLMALADHADHEGNNVYPGLELLSYKTQYSERQLRRILDSLEESGILVPVNGGIGRGQRQHYRINIKAAPLKPEKRSKCPVNSQEKSGHPDNGKADKMSAFDGLKADILTTEKRTFSTQKADISGFAYKEEPSIEPSVVVTNDDGDKTPATLSFEKFAKRETSIQEREFIKHNIPPAKYQAWATFVALWFVDYPDSKKLAKVFQVFTEQEREQTAKVINGGFDWRTHYSDGREKPKGIRGLVV